MAGAFWRDLGGPRTGKYRAALNQRPGAGKINPTAPPVAGIWRGRTQDRNLINNVIDGLQHDGADPQMFGHCCPGPRGTRPAGMRGRRRRLNSSKWAPRNLGICGGRTLGNLPGPPSSHQGRRVWWGKVYSAIARIEGFPAGCGHFPRSCPGPGWVDAGLHEAAPGPKRPRFPGPTRRPRPGGELLGATHGRIRSSGGRLAAGSWLASPEGSSFAPVQRARRCFSVMAAFELDGKHDWPR